MIVFADALLVVIPGEAAVTIVAALSVVHSPPPRGAVAAVAALSALAARVWAVYTSFIGTAIARVLPARPTSVG